MLSEKTKEVVKSTHPLLQGYGVAITTHMFERLFDENPEIKAFFANTKMAKQSDWQTQFLHTVKILII